jgi:hypothetical protein
MIHSSRTFLILVSSTFNDPTEIPCPNCSKSVRLNPFTIKVDWKPLAEAQQKSENKRY